MTERRRRIPPLREAFIKHLIADPDMNAAAAYRKAGYKVKNDQVAATCASKLLRIAYIADAIDREKERRARRLNASADKTLLKLMRGQEFDIRKLYKWNDDVPPRVVLRHPLELDDDTAAAVVGVKYKDGVIEEYKIIDVKGCAIAVGDHLGMFRQRIEHTGKDGVPLEMYSLEAANRILVLLKKARMAKGEVKDP